MGSVQIRHGAVMENPWRDLRAGMRMNRAGLRKAFAEGMVASGIYEEDKKSCQNEADCSTNRHLIHYVAPTPTATALNKLSCMERVSH